MKKKLGVFLFIISSIFSLTSCQEKKDKIIIEKEENISDLIHLTTNDFTRMISQSESFIISYGESQCTTCISFKSILKNIAIEKELRIYEMDISDYLNAPFAKNYQYYNLGLVLIQDGEMKYNFSAIKKWDKEISSFNKESSIQTVKTDLEKYCFLDSPFYEIDKEKALEKIQNEKEVYIYYMRKTCGDCKSFHQHFLNQWILDGKYDSNKKIYNFNIDPYREITDGGLEAPSYVEFKNTFQLSLEGNATFGYKTGVVPTVQKYVNGQLTKMAVIYNDEINWETMTVESGYYKDSPFINQAFDSYGDYQQKTTSFYQEKFLEVIDEKK